MSRKQVEPQFTPAPVPRKGVRKHLTLAEWRKLLAQARGAGLFEHALIRLLYECGLRAQEPGDLRLDHLKLLGDNRLFVPRAKGSTTGWQDISPAMGKLLRQWTQQVYRVSAAEAARRAPAGYVFPGMRRMGPARGVSRKTVWRIVKELMLGAGIPPGLAHPHAIKHSRVQHLFEEAEAAGLAPEAALQTIARIVGHRSAMTSWQHYVAETGKGRAVAQAALAHAMEE